MILLLLPVDVRYEERDRYYAAIRAYRDKEKYSTRPESKTEGMAKLLAESELAKLFIDAGGGSSNTESDVNVNGSSKNNFEM